MTHKKTPTLKQLMTEPTDAAQAPTVALRTIWNTTCGGYPAAALIAAAGAGGKPGADGSRKTSRVRAKAV